MTQAIDALILEKLGFDPEGKAAWRQRQEALNRLEPIPEIRPIVRAYHEKADVLHGNCFHEGICEPKQVVQDQIREVNRYIEDIRKLIGA